MSARFEVLDQVSTPLGIISLWRRHESTIGLDIFEVKLGDEYLMSSMFTAAEIALARLGLSQTTGDSLDVLVGGLGLGYTAQAALEDPRVRSLSVVEALGAVIDWHERDLLPDTVGLAADPRTRLVEGDFFSLVADHQGIDTLSPKRFHAILLDIDHTPDHVLHPSHQSFYTPAGLTRLHDHLHPTGVFALWSDDPPDPDFVKTLERAFTTVDSHIVGFPNPLTGGDSANTVYVASGRAPRTSERDGAHDRETGSATGLLLFALLLGLLAAFFVVIQVVDGDDRPCYFENC